MAVLACARYDACMSLPTKPIEPRTVQTIEDLGPIGTDPSVRIGVALTPEQLARKAQIDAAKTWAELEATGATYAEEEALGCVWGDGEA